MLPPRRRPPSPDVSCSAGIRPSLRVESRSAKGVIVHAPGSNFEVCRIRSISSAERTAECVRSAGKANANRFMSSELSSLTVIAEDDSVRIPEKDCVLLFAVLNQSANR